MLEKIKSNYTKIVFLASVVAAALLVPAFVSLFTADLSDSVIFTLIQYSLLLASNVVLAVVTFTKKSICKYSMIAAFISFFGSLLLINIYYLINDSLSSLVMAILYASILVLYALSFTNSKIKNVLLVLLLIAVAFLLASALSGGAYSLSVLITSVILGSNLVLNKEGE